jgi:transcriptional regulator with XRE-family HTH domain
MAPDADVLIGRRLRALRLERALSLMELASRAGISVSALSQIERGISSLKIKVMWPLAAALNVEPGALLGEGGADTERFVLRLFQNAQASARTCGWD